MLGFANVVVIHVLQVRNFLSKAEKVVRKVGHYFDHTLVSSGCVHLFVA